MSTGTIFGMQHGSGALKFTFDDGPYEFTCRAYLTELLIEQERIEHYSSRAGIMARGPSFIAGPGTATARFELMLGMDGNLEPVHAKANGGLGDYSVLDLLKEVNRRLEVDK